MFYDSFVFRRSIFWTITKIFSESQYSLSNHIDNMLSHKRSTITSFTLGLYILYDVTEDIFHIRYNMFLCIFPKLYLNSWINKYVIIIYNWKSYSSLLCVLKIKWDSCSSRVSIFVHVCWWAFDMFNWFSYQNKSNLSMFNFMHHTHSLRVTLNEF